MFDFVTSRVDSHLFITSVLSSTFIAPNNGVQSIYRHDKVTSEQNNWVVCNCARVYAFVCMCAHVNNFCIKNYRDRRILNDPQSRFLVIECSPNIIHDPQSCFLVIEDSPNIILTWCPATTCVCWDVCQFWHLEFPFAFQQTYESLWWRAVHASWTHWTQTHS